MSPSSSPSTPTDFTGRVVAISGAAGGIGSEAVRQFAAAGATVVALDINHEALEASIRGAHGSPGSAFGFVCDLTDGSAVQRTVSEIESVHGPIDVLYNNAGGSSLEDGPVHELPAAELERALAIDVLGTVNLSRAVLQGMVTRKRGAVVHTTSCVAMIGFPGCDAYTMAKGAIVSLTRSMAAEYAQFGIRVNAIAPGLTLTDRLKHFIEVSPVIAARAKRHLLGVCEARDVVNAALYLASDSAARVTGIVLPVDSGLTTTTE